MAETSTKSYQRLPGTGYRRLVPAWAMILMFFVIGIFVLLLRGRRVQLWLGDDHLLIVDWDGYREFYKRINYRDIQSLVIYRTAEGKIVNIILGTIAVLFASFGLTVGDAAGMIALLIIAAIFGLLLLANALSGPTCRCQLRTAVQTEELHSLTRYRTARKAFDRLRPLIVAVQGVLPPEEIPQRLQSLTGAGGQSPGSSFIMEDPNAPPRVIS